MNYISQYSKVSLSVRIPNMLLVDSSCMFIYTFILLILEC